MKRRIAALLCLVLLFSGCASASQASAVATFTPAAVETPTPAPEPTSAPTPEPTPEPASEPTPEPTIEPDFAGCVEPQAFALTMACWLADRAEGEDWREDTLYWDAAGWYAAWLYRTQGADLLDRERAEAFLLSLGAEVSPLPEGWEEYGVVRVLRGSDGREQYDFVQHKLEMDEMLGVNTEVAVRPAPDESAVSLLTYHYEDGQEAHWHYVFRFAQSGGGDFPWVLTDLELPPRGAETDPALTFDWDDLTAANRLSNLLSLYSSVRVCNENYAPDVSDWLFLHRGDLAILTQAGGWINGEYRGCRFNYETTDEGGDRPVIWEFDPDAGSLSAREGYFMENLNGVAVMRLEKITGDVIRAQATFRGGGQETVCVDLGTLALREISYRFSPTELPSADVFHYDEPVPFTQWLDSWDGPMRTVTLCWEDWTDGQYSAWTEVWEIPDDWELIPWQAQWGEFTIWMDAGSTQPYKYPGDGASYTLYLSSAKG